MNDELISIYMDRFINQTCIWGKQWVSRDKTSFGYAYQKPDMDTNNGKYIYEQVTADLVKQHIAGEITCGWTAIDERCRSKWLCFDSDTDDGDLDKFEIALKSWGLHVIREGRRPGRAGHMWILFDQPVESSKLIVLGNAMMRLAKVRPNAKDYPHGIELFPKSANALSQVRGPLGINRKPEANNSRGWFDGAELNIYTQLEWLVVQPLNRAEDAIREAEKYKPKSEQTKPSLKRQHRKAGRFRRINILAYVDHRKFGQGFVAQCPLCAIEGHDHHHDNLRITADGLKFCCVFGGPAQVHKTDDIVNALLAKRTLNHNELIA